MRDSLPEQRMRCPFYSLDVNLKRYTREGGDVYFGCLKRHVRGQNGERRDTTSSV